MELVTGHQGDSGTIHTRRIAAGKQRFDATIACLDVESYFGPKIVQQIHGDGDFPIDIQAWRRDRRWGLHGPADLQVAGPRLVVQNRAQDLLCEALWVSATENNLEVAAARAGAIGSFRLGGTAAASFRFSGARADSRLEMGSTDAPLARSGCPGLLARTRSRAVVVAMMRGECDSRLR